MNTPNTYVAFADSVQIARGNLAEMARTVKPLVDAGDTRTLLVFASPTGEQTDLDLRGSLDNVLAGIAEPRPNPVEAPPLRRSPGRPKLGVVGREITLLPRHWEWLNAQPGGASVALRKLVEKARLGNQGADRVRQSREAVFRFISAIAGNEAGFEEASRALFAGSREDFFAHTRAWPGDVREFAIQLAEDAF